MRAIWPGSIPAIRDRLQQIPEHTERQIRLRRKSTGFACTIGVFRVVPNLLQTKRSRPELYRRIGIQPSYQSVFAPRCDPVANVIRPLPGVLDPRAFERARVDLGRCDICMGEGGLPLAGGAGGDL
jgi:hypothetical protein